MKDSEPKKYWNPYLAGIGLGLVLLAAFVIMGRGLGASGAFTSMVAVGVESLAPKHAELNGMYSEYLDDSKGHPLKDWLVFEIIGVLIGGFISGFFSGRVNISVEKGPRIQSPTRIVFALLGGLLMGFSAKMARGCTSGQALTGGALLSLGSWIFMLSVFVGAYLFAYIMRRQWI